MEAVNKKMFRAIVRGRVQMVMYRDFAQRHARKLGIVGTAQNLPDGAVEIYAQGDEPALMKYIEQLKRGPFFSKVESIEIAWPDEAAKDRDDFIVL